MSLLTYQQNELFLEQVNLTNVAEQFGTPTYAYSQSLIHRNWHSFQQAFKEIPNLLCYAVKANSNIHILKLLASYGAGFDIVSLGELQRAILSGVNPEKIIFSGVGKQIVEIDYAIETGIHCFNVESEAEIDRLNLIAQAKNKIINISLRINPNVDPHTHTYISTGLKENKFGIAITQIVPLCRKLQDKKNLKLIGIACHIGSQLTKLKPFLLAIDRLLEIYAEIKLLGLQLQHINIGGGLGIIYKDEQPPSVDEYAKSLITKLSRLPIKLILEPGRIILGNAGVLLTRVEYLKQTSQKNFAIVDAGMNDFIRPALYDAWQNILPVRKHNNKSMIYDIVGPVCESSDFIGKNRQLAINEGDLLAVEGCGAYGFSMASNYNSRCRAAEVLIHESSIQLIRRRETITDLLALEQL